MRAYSFFFLIIRMLLKRYDLYWVHEKKEELSKNRLLTTHSQLS